MSSAAAAVEAPAGDAAPKGKSKKKLILIAVPVLLVVVLAGLWFSGILPGLLGMSPKPEAPMKLAEEAAAAAKPAVFLELPEMVANLNSASRRPVFVKLKAKLELATTDDTAGVTTAMPKLLDLFQTYLRETRPEELHGAIGTWRLRQELIARANIAAFPARVTDILFTEMLVQ